MAFLDPNLTFSLNHAVKYTLLRVLNLIYNGLIRLWLLGYKTGLKSSYRGERKVISVGNITVGGTGKTPLVDWILTLCQRRGIKAAVLTRGYKSKSAAKIQLVNQGNLSSTSPIEIGDEPWMLLSRHPEVDIVVSSDRVQGAKLIEKKADLLILDDGMQHLKIQRDLNIALIDTHQGIGNGHLIPLGPLREPLSSLDRADIILYTKVSESRPQHHLRRQIESHLTSARDQYDSQYVPDTVRSSTDASSHPTQLINGKACLLFSGIGNPSAFEQTITEAGGSVVDHLVLEDHQEYDTATINRVREFIEARPCDLVLCTEKDWVKLAEKRNELPEIHILLMKVQPDAGFTQRFEEWLNEHFRVKTRTNI